MRIASRQFSGHASGCAEQAHDEEERGGLTTRVRLPIKAALAHVRRLDGQSLAPTPIAVL